MMGAWVYDENGNSYYDPDEGIAWSEWQEVYYPYQQDEWYDDDDVEYVYLGDECLLELSRPRRDKMYILRWNPGRSKRGDHGEAADANYIPF